jgi:hypothetical protein
MHNEHKLFVDTHSTVYDLLAPYAHGEFWEFSTFEPPLDSVCVIGRRQFVDNLVKIRSLIETNQCRIIFDNSAEGSQTLQQQIEAFHIQDLIAQKKILLISGGDLAPQYQYLLHDHFVNVILGYEYNIDSMSRTAEIYSKKIKPYKFLFLNGRARPHRKYLWEKFQSHGILSQSLCTMLEGRPPGTSNYTLHCDGVDLMATHTPIIQLPSYYEVEQYQDRCIDVAQNDNRLIKHDLFNNTWGEIYVKPEPYIDTYFSLVTETVTDYPYSFRTEKIAKPLLIGHPWIAVANRGFYRDLKNLGFRTFEHLIDESFDQIDNPQDRIDRIVDIVDDLVQQDLANFLESCYSTCKYNQSHLQEYRESLRCKFPDRFFKFIDERS